MRNRRRQLALTLLAGVAALGLVTLIWATGTAFSGEGEEPRATLADASGAVAPGCGGDALGMANPAAVYCRELGYDYKIVDTSEGQQGVCAFPDGGECNEWAFLQGQCGQSHSYCARHGYGSKVKTDGMNGLSKVYSVCTRGQEEIGAATELMGLSEESTRGSLTVEPSAGSSGEEDPMVGAPPSFDWRSYNGQNWMTSVKNQGQCGSCWAFSAVGVVEATYNIAASDPNLDLDLSEEYLVSDCLWDNNCCGGWMGTALSFVRDQGVPDEACLPYVDLSSCRCDGGTCSSTPPWDCTYRTEGSCSDATCSQRCSDWQSRVETIEDVYQISAGEMKQTLVDNGPLSVAMGIGSGAPYYGYWDGDIYRCTNDSGANHGVIIVGYNDAGGYWIVKNSWGSSWGDGGYFKLGYGECWIGNYSLYVDVGAPSPPDQDGDTVPDASDNCPSVSNPTQTDTDGDGLGDACDLDDDGDEFIDEREDYLVTDYLDACPDSPSDAAWPLDLNNDTQLSVAGDVLNFRGTIGATPGGPNWSQRLDLNGDGQISVTGDVLSYSGRIGQTCS